MPLARLDAPELLGQPFLELFDVGGPAGQALLDRALHGDELVAELRARIAFSFGDVAVGPFERNLARALARFPLVVLDAVERRGPQRLHGYLGELAAEFHVFYRNCRVLTDDPEVAVFRAGLCVATRTTLAKGLELLGVSAPESM